MMKSRKTIIFAALALGFSLAGASATATSANAVAAIAAASASASQPTVQNPGAETAGQDYDAAESAPNGGYVRPVAGDELADSLMAEWKKMANSEGVFLKPLQERDTTLIGDQFLYGVHLKEVPAGTQIAVPEYSEGYVENVEIVMPFFADTLKAYGKRKAPEAHDIDLAMVITSFEEGRHVLPPIAIGRILPGSETIDTLVFEPQSIDVFTMPVDTTTYQIHDIKGQINYPVTFAELLPWLGGLWLLIVLGILVWALTGLKKRQEAEAEARKDPPYVVALRKLDAFRGNKYWAPEKQKAYYSGITDALREYIDARYGIDAPEMTTAEIFRDLRTSGLRADLYEDLKKLFETADLVKFAKAYATDEENAAALPAAVRFVTTTYQEQLEEEQPEEEEVKQEETLTAERKYDPKEDESRFVPQGWDLKDKEGD